MINKQIQKLTPTRLRLLLMASMLLVAVVSAAGFWYFRGQLTTYANQVNAASAAAVISKDKVAQLQKLQTELNSDQVAVTRAENIVADSQHYQYQNQIISDLTNYAKAAGLTITGFTFSNDTVGSEASPAPQPPGTPATPAGLKSLTASVSVKSPVSYRAIMNFARAIELNLTKMNITSISLSRDTQSSKVIVNPINIEVYTR